MKRSNVNFVLDALAFISFVALTATGVLMRFILPPGSGRRVKVWGMDRHEWGGVHFWISLAFLALVALHLFMHWRWVGTVVKGRSRQGARRRLAMGAVALLAIVVLAVSPFFAPVEEAGAGKAVLEIKGTTNFSDIEAATGVPAGYLIRALELPESTSPEEKLGKLRKRQEFEIRDVRRLVRDYDHEEPAK